MPLPPEEMLGEKKRSGEGWTVTHCCSAKYREKVQTDGCRTSGWDEGFMAAGARFSGFSLYICSNVNRNSSNQGDHAFGSSKWERFCVYWRKEAVPPHILKSRGSCHLFLEQLCSIVRKNEPKH